MICSLTNRGAGLLTLRRVKVCKSISTACALASNREFSLCSYPEGEVVEGVSDSLAVRFLANFIYVPYERMADRSESLLLDSLVTAGHDHLIRVTGRDGTVSEVSLNRIVADRGITTCKKQQTDI